LGGTILIGVRDDGTIEGIEASKRKELKERVANIARNSVIPSLSPKVDFVTLDGKMICVIEISKGLHKPYQTLDGKYLLRIGSTNRSATKEELSRLFQQAGLVHFDIAPIEGSSKMDLNEQKLHDYWHLYYDIDYLALESQEQSKLLANSDITDEQGLCTVGGLLMFGRYPQKRLPHSSVMFAVFRGVEIEDEMLDKKEIVGTIDEMIDRCSELIKLFIPKSSTILGNKRAENTKIENKVIREAIVNALVHRDYSLQHQKVRIFVFSNRLEIASPGKLPNTLTIDKILVGNSSPRNMFLVKFLDNMRYIDGIGRGIPLIKKEMGNMVEFEEIGEIFIIRLYWDA
jgi:ATP-dependent DNA helicase RecG